jgi:hypothetical protein
MLPLAGEDFVFKMKFGDCQTGEVAGYEAFGPGMVCPVAVLPSSLQRGL